MKLSTDLYLGKHPRAIVLDNTGAIVAAACMRKGETPRDALARNLSHWQRVEANAKRAADKFAAALEGITE